MTVANRNNNAYHNIIILNNNVGLSQIENGGQDSIVGISPCLNVSISYNIT